MTLLPAQILLTLATLGYGMIPALVDLNATHATNPLWTGHARFHVVWQVSSYVCIGLISLALIWGPGPAHTGRLWLASLLAAAAYTGFYTAVVTKRMYGGANFDANGVPPVHVTLLGKKLALDANITIFTVTSLLLVIGIVCLSLSEPA
jgi:hypothetical protein